MLSSNGGMVQNDPRKHHYIPVFYLRQWTKGGFLHTMRKVHHGKITSERKSPNGTGYKKDLYKIDGVPRDVEQHMEKVFMRMVDGDAADALVLLKSGKIAAWPVRERDGWVRFLLSTLFRNPESVQVIKLHFQAIWEQGLELLQAQYEKRRGPNDPAAFEEFYNKTNPYASAVAASNFMQVIMNSEVIGNTIAHMKWATVHLRNSKFDLLTSDRPIDIPLSLAQKDAYILLPIGPKELFVASNDVSFQQQFLAANHSEVVRTINQRTVGRAREYVWGVNDAALGFVRKHISTFPDRPILTEKAREQSLKEARRSIMPP